MACLAGAYRLCQATMSTRSIRSTSSKFHLRLCVWQGVLGVLRKGRETRDTPGSWLRGGGARGLARACVWLGILGVLGILGGRETRSPMLGRVICNFAIRNSQAAAELFAAGGLGFQGAAGIVIIGGLKTNAAWHRAWSSLPRWRPCDYERKIGY